ncbi:MAG: ABC transporter permease [Bacteroidales bacterium]
MNRLIVFFENFRIALRAIRSNMLRTVLTVFIIAFGIMALVGILTAIDAIKGSITEQFTSMGANTFTIKSKEVNVQRQGDRSRTRNYNYISYREAMEFKERYDFPAVVSVFTRATGTGTVKYDSEKSDPNVPVIGADENYLFTSGFNIEYGRFFSREDIILNRNVAVIGSSLRKKILKNNVAPLGKEIIVGSGRYRVIGVLAEKGTSMMGTGDLITILPYTNVRQNFSKPGQQFTISVLPANQILLENATGEAEVLFRIIRNLNLKDESDFMIERSDKLVDILITDLKKVTLAATIIGIITLFGAAIGLMNIMLVSVTDRTREIGIRKAVGAKSRTIKQQFLFEAITIGQLGGFLGIILGVLIGNLVSMGLNTDFIAPWRWILGGIVLCFLVSIVSGYFPAVRASKLDPIVSLRYE